MAYSGGGESQAAVTLVATHPLGVLMNLNALIHLARFPLVKLIKGKGQAVGWWSHAAKHPATSLGYKS